MSQNLNQSILKYKSYLNQGEIQRAYRGIMQYLMELKRHLIRAYPRGFISGHIYFGFMDISFIQFTPGVLKKKKLKIVIVFDHPSMQFEIWLCGQNKKVQQEYWQLFKNSEWKDYQLSENAQAWIIKEVLVERPDFNNQRQLTQTIEEKSMKFINAITSFLT